MSFDDSYQLLELAGDEGVKTFIARQISTEKTVTVFLFVGEQAQAHAELLHQLRATDQAQLPDLIEIGDNRGTVYVVVEPRLSFAQLKDRASQQRTVPTPPPGHKPEEFTRAGIWRIPPSLQSTPGRSEKRPDESAIFDKQPLQEEAPTAPGSFTQMFQAAAPPIDEPVPEAPAAPPPPPVPQPDSSAPGSFTQMFQATAPPIGEPVPEAPVAPPPPAPAQAAPGEFTRMFQAAAPPLNEAKPETPKAPPAQSGPGSFAQMFQAAAPPIGEKKAEATQKAPAPLEPGEFTRFFNAAPAAPPVSAPMPPKSEAQGDFARIFGSSDRQAGSPSTVTGIFHQSSSTPAIETKHSGGASSLTAPPAFTPPPGEFTRIFGETSPLTPSAGPIAPAPPPASPPPASGPGEYTRMFSAPPIPPEPIATPAPQPAAAPESQGQAKRNSMLVPILIGVIVLLLAAIAVILVAIK